MAIKPSYEELEQRVMALEKEVVHYRKTEEELEYVNKNMIDMVESISDGFFSLDDQSKVTYFNKAAETLLGRKRDEVIDRNLFEAFPEAKGSIFEEKYTIGIKEKRFLTFETFFDIAPYENWYDVRAYPQEHGISVFFQVTTERKRAEAELRESEARFRDIASNIPGVVYQFLLKKDGSFSFPYMSKRARAILDIDAEEIMANPYSAFKIIFEEDLDAVNQSIVESARTSEVWEQEFRIRDKAGDIRWIRGKATSRAFPDGEVLWNGVLFDVTDHKHAEEALQKSENKFRSLFHSMNEGVALHELMYDENGAAVDYMIIDTNPAYELHTGIASKDAVGHRVSKLYGTGEPPFFDIYQHVATSGQSTDFEAYFDPLKKHFSVSVFSPEKGKFATVFQNITERKQMEEALQKAHGELESRVKERTAELEHANEQLKHEIEERKRTEEDLRESEQRLELALKGGDLGYWDLDIKTGKVVRNERTAEIYGYTLDEMEEDLDWWEERIHPEDKPGVLEALHGHIAGKRPIFEAEYRLLN